MIGRCVGLHDEDRSVALGALLASTACPRPWITRYALCLDDRPEL